jgi:hypothetical protein
VEGKNLKARKKPNPLSGVFGEAKHFMIKVPSTLREQYQSRPPDR